MMPEALVQAASRFAECCALLSIGYNLKQAGILRPSDGETAIKVATTLTLPSVIVQALGNGGPLGVGAASLVGVAVVCFGAQLAATWLYCMHRSVRERAVLAGSSTGLSLSLYGYPIVECFLGGRAAGAALAMQSVAMLDLVNHVAVWLCSYMFFAGAGPAFPESFKHEDGGEYRGQWRAMKKEGLGVYTYASGARYEGEWRDNVKEGRGVYYFPKGGLYEGEWSSGNMNGLGVRTFSTGQVKAGRWLDARLETPLELWQVALAADGATAVAAAARSVEVGGGRLVDAAHMLAGQPTLWALLVGIAINIARVPLPTSVDLATGFLAQVNTPLVLLAAGVTAPALTALPRGLPQLLPDIARLLGARLLVPLTVGLNLLALLVASTSGADGVVGGGNSTIRVALSSLVPLTAALIALLAPVPPQALANARRFRLNEQTAAAITSASLLVCVPFMMLAGITAAAAGLAASPIAAATAANATADVRPLGLVTVAALAAVSAAVSYASRASVRQPNEGRILMVYAGPHDSTTQGPAANPTAASGSTSGSRHSPGTGSSISGTMTNDAEALPSASSGSLDGGESGKEGSAPNTSNASGTPGLPPSNANAVAGLLLLRGAASCWCGRARSRALKSHPTRLTARLAVAVAAIGHYGGRSCRLASGIRGAACTLGAATGGDSSGGSGALVKRVPFGQLCVLGSGWVGARTPIVAARALHGSRTPLRIAVPGAR